jgi:putative addiction module killer protein
MEILQYLDTVGRNPFAEWFDDLDPQSAARVTIAMARLEQGNLSNVKTVGSGVLEYRIDFGPGYRIYFGRDGETIIILLAGGMKRRQRQDINTAHSRWEDYKRRRARGR